MVEQIKDIQKKIKIFCKDNDMDCKPEYRALDLSSEVGEISKEILKMSNYGNKKIKINKEIKLEIGDSFFSLIALANSLDLDLEESLTLVLNKYKKRLMKGSASSEND